MDSGRFMAPLTLIAPVLPQENFATGCVPNALKFKEVMKKLYRRDKPHQFCHNKAFLFPPSRFFFLVDSSYTEHSLSTTWICFNVTTIAIHSYGCCCAHEYLIDYLLSRMRKCAACSFQ